jgi:signal transduction histidine kinase
MKTFNIRYRSVEKLKDFLALHQLSTQENILVQIFTANTQKSQVLSIAQSIQVLLPFATVIGCSSDGEIMDGKVIEQNTIVSITLFEKSHIKMVFLQEDEISANAGKKIAKKLIEKETKALIILATFQGLNAQTLLEDIYHDNKAGQGLVISGALASDYGRFKSSFVFDSQQITSHGIIALSISGKSLYASNHYVHDWEPISRKFRVNAAVANRVEKVDGKAIKSLYSQYIGSKDVGALPLYALQFPFVAKRQSRHISKQIVLDSDDGSLTFSSNIKKGEILQIAFANIDKIESSSEKMFLEISQQPVETLFIYASSARRRFIEYFCHKEIDALKSLSPIAGFFGFSEFFANEAQCNLLSQSMSVLALSENQEIETHPLPIRKNSLHKELDYKTVKVLSNIAQVSSNELEELNKKLEQRVREGVKANRKKDSIMIHNSKLAQLGEMMGLIAHQWRQPLSAISATASGMQIKFELDSWTPEYVESSLTHIEEYVQHLSDTINDFTDFFKPSKKREPIMIRDIIKKALFIMSPLLTKESVLVVKKFASENRVETYPNEVVQVVLNLLKNAVNAQIKNAIKNPEIYINEYQKDGKNIIEVSDNAGGIDEKIIDKIFEPYFSTKNSENSMGLGLYMSKFIMVDSCGGNIEVENIADGVKFTITL